jgi:hypothetical protein
MKKFNVLKIILLFLIIFAIFYLVYFITINLDDFFLNNSKNNENNFLYDINDNGIGLDIKQKISDLSSSGSVIFKKNESVYDGYNVCGNILFDNDGNIVDFIPLFRTWNFYDDYGIINMDDIHKKPIQININNLMYEINLTGHHYIEKSYLNDTILFVSDYLKNYKNRDINFDIFYEVDLQGNIIKNWSTYDHLNEIHFYFNKTALDFELDEEYNKHVIIGDYQYNKDYFHANHIQSLPHNVYEENDSRFKAGNWLVSFPYQGLIAIIDYDSEKIVWDYGVGEIYGQHCSQMIDNGNILIFDNGYLNRNYSRVIEVNPITKKIVWEFNASDYYNYYTIYEGCAQRLPNNNTLITLSDEGKALEVTSNKEVVWIWKNPVVPFYDQSRNTATYKVVRINETQKNLLMNAFLK